MFEYVIECVFRKGTPSRNEGIYEKINHWPLSCTEVRLSQKTTPSHKIGNYVRIWSY